MDLQFTLKNQVINRIDRNTVVSGSRNYLYAKFTFLSEDWHAPVTVIFGKYSMVLDGENKCLVPWEVLENPGSFTVSAFCGNLQTANTVSVYVEKSGYIQGETPEEPTPDVYTQLAGMVQDTIERAEEATEAATGAVEKTEGFAAEAEKSAQAAAQSEQLAAESATAAGSMATNAAASAQAAQQSAEQAAQVVAGAGQIVKDAETAALLAVNEAEAAAVSTVNQAGQSQIDTVNNAGASALSAIDIAKTDALNGIDTAKNVAVEAVNTANTQAIESAQTAITTAKNQAVSDVQTVGQSAVSSVGDAQTNAVQAVQNAGTAEAEKISGILPVPTEADAGKVPVAKPDGTGYELGMVQGGGGDKVLIAHQTLSEEVQMLQISTDDEGNPFRLKMMQLFINIKGSAQNTSRGNMYLSVNSKITNQAVITNALREELPYPFKVCVLMWAEERGSIGFWADGNAGASAMFQALNSGQYITEIHAFGQKAEAATFGAGTEYWLYGVKA